MRQLIESQIKSLSVEGLRLLAEDVEHRIGSHSAGGAPLDAYIKHQRFFLDLVQGEMKRRREMK